MLRVFTVALVVLLMAGCGPSKTRQAFDSINNAAIQAHASGGISESERFRRSLRAFVALPASDKSRSAYVASYYEQRMQVAEAYEKKQISVSKYLELKRKIMAFKSERDDALLKERRRRSDAVSKVLSDYQKTLNRPRYIPAPKMDPDPTPRTLNCTPDPGPYSRGSMTCQ